VFIGSKFSFTCIRLLTLIISTYSDQHSGIYRQSEIEQDVMVFADDKGLHISSGVDYGKQASEGNITEEELV